MGWVIHYGDKLLVSGVTSCFFQVTRASNPVDNLFQDGDFNTNTEKGDNFQDISNPYEFNR